MLKHTWTQGKIIYFNKEKSNTGFLCLLGSLSHRILSLSTDDVFATLIIFHLCSCTNLLPSSLSFKFPCISLLTHLHSLLGTGKHGLSNLTSAPGHQEYVYPFLWISKPTRILPTLRYDSKVHTFLELFLNKSPLN